MNWQQKEECLQLKKRKGMEGIHTIQNMKSRRRNPLKEIMFLQRRDIFFSERKCMTTSRRKIPPRFFVPPPVSPGQEWHVVQHKKFPQKLTRTQKKKKKNTEKELWRKGNSMKYLKKHQRRRLRIREIEGINNA